MERLHNMTGIYDYLHTYMFGGLSRGSSNKPAKCMYAVMYGVVEYIYIAPPAPARLLRGTKQTRLTDKAP